LWGGHLLGYHLVSLALHLCSGLLIWRLLNRLGLRWGWIGGLLFVIHPLSVESVAWITELKNTLSLPLFLLSLDAWLDLEEGKGRFGYARFVVFYLLAMLSKTSVVMLPAVVLLYCWWKRGRVSRKEVLKMIPCFLIALILGSVTFWFQNSHLPDVYKAQMGGILSRVAGAGTAVFFYLWKFVCPTGLLMIYPPWKVDPPSPLQILSVAAIGAALVWFWMRRGSWGRHALLGFGFFLLMVLPVLGLANMSYLGISRVADHFVYLPMIGLIGLVAAGLEGGCKKLSLRPYLFGMMAALGLFLAWESHWYASLFSGPGVLWMHVLQKNPNAWAVHTDLADLLAAIPGRQEAAIEEYEKALQLNPDYSMLHNNFGNLLMSIPGRLPEAMTEYREAIRLNPEYSPAHNNLGGAFERKGLKEEAMAEYKTAIRLDSKSVSPHNNLGGILETMPGRTAEAIAEYETALRLDPDDPTVHYNLGSVLAKMPDHLPDAIEQYRIALRLDPDVAAVHNNLGVVYAETPGRLSDAIAEYKTALRLDPKYLEARNNLGNALARVAGREEEAIAEYEEALRVRPDFFEAHSNLGSLLAKMPGRKQEAISHLQAALAIRPNAELVRRLLNRLQEDSPQSVRQLDQIATPASTPRGD